MCIRDSVGAGRTHAVAGVVGRAALPVEAGHHGRVAVGVGPVSYTHLRAHETVLELVCRLLLEKKKIKK